MNFNQLHAFYAVTQNDSFTKAAKHLRISQPAVTKHIRDLETSYGVRLFERTTRKINLTEPGRTLLSFAHRIFTLTAEAELSLKSVAGLKSGRMEIGTSRTVGTYYITPFAVAFKKAYPGVTLSIRIENSQWVLEQILNLQLDLGVVGVHVKNDHLVVLPLVEEELFVVIPAGHPWARRKSIFAQELNNEPLIMREKGSGTRELVETELASIGVKPNVTMELGSNEAIKRAVEQSVGLALLPPTVVQTEINQGVLKSLRLKGVQPVLAFNIIYHKDKASSPLVQAFLRFFGPKEPNRRNVRAFEEYTHRANSFVRNRETSRGRRGRGLNYDD